MLKSPFNGQLEEYTFDQDIKSSQKFESTSMESGQFQNLTETSTVNQSSTSTESLLDDQYSSSLGEIDCYLKALNVSYQFEKGKFNFIFKLLIQSH